MLNTTIKLGSQNITFNAPCSGILQKSNPRSTFIHFHKTSLLNNIIFPCDGSNPSICLGWRNNKPVGEIEIVVLQILATGDYYLVEVIESKYINE